MPRHHPLSAHPSVRPHGSGACVRITDLHEMNIGQLRQRVREYRAGVVSKDVGAAIDWNQEAKFVRNKNMFATPTTSAAPPTPSSADRTCSHAVLVTGVTGFLGPLLLGSLLSLFAEPWVLFVVVRGDGGRVRLVKLLEDAVAAGADVCRAALHWLKGGAAGRVRVIEGDLSIPNLPFLRQHHALNECIGQGGLKLVVHNAAHVSSVLPYRALRSANVTSSAALANLAINCNCPMLFVSSISSIHCGNFADEKYHTPVRTSIVWN